MVELYHLIQMTILQNGAEETNDNDIARCEGKKYETINCAAIPFPMPKETSSIPQESLPSLTSRLISEVFQHSTLDSTTTTCFCFLP